MQTFLTPAILKKRGRPATGAAPSRTFRLSDEFIAVLDAWTADQPDQPTDSEALRRLVEIGLTTRTRALPSQRLRSARADRAKELANIIDPAARSEERIARKRRVTKRPADFRDRRVGLPTSKNEQG